jgi:folate-binding protein YgfZ
MEIVSDIVQEITQIRSHCGYFNLDDWSAVSCSGKDVFDYLQTQTTNDVKELTVGKGQNNAVCDRKGKLIAAFSGHRTEEFSVLLLAETVQKELLVKHLEAFIFREDVTLSPPEGMDALLAVQGPKSGLILETLTDSLILPQKTNDVASFELDGQKGFIVNKSLTCEEGFILCISTKLKLRIQEFLENANACPISENARETLRIEAGIPIFGKDMDNSNVLPETGLEHSSVSYNKGCYIGQEVIARIKTYGSPSYALMGLIIEGDTPPPYNGEILFGGKKIGYIKSSTYSHTLDKNIALAYMQKEHRSPDIDLSVEINSQPFQTKTALLPFFQTATRSDHARKLHQEALGYFKDEENLDKPIAVLREAIELDPKYAAAYEALGVLLSKQNKLDEAISLMKKLAEIDPMEIMAHSNLSIYYMQQGRIEDAEKEKAEATAIEFDKLISAKMDEKKKAKDAEKKKKDQEEKMGMFLQVLEIDENDQVANFGLGSIYADQGFHEKALPHFQILVEYFPDYSVAYNLLGKTLEKLSKIDEALEVYKKGIAAASKKGDLMPLKEMQSRQYQLLHSDS